MIDDTQKGKLGTAVWGPPAFPKPPSAAERGHTFTSKLSLAWSTGVALRSGKVVVGGSPFRVQLLPVRVRPFARKLFAARRAGIVPETTAEQKAAVYLLDIGAADPLPGISSKAPKDVAVVVPVYKHATELEGCLAALEHSGLQVIVVDDASPRAAATRIARVAEKFGATLIVRDTNGGPGAARTTGFEATDAPFVAFVDADVIPSADWVARLRPLFADPAVGALGPRVLPQLRGTGRIELYEETRSELDMGPVPARVIYAGPVGWLPSASVIVRRSAVTSPPFEPGLRVGEDVDLFWRMDEAGWTVRYVPDVVNRHEVRNSLREFSYRRAMYGGSAADLERRHPRRLIPARPSASGLAVLALVSFGKFKLAGAVTLYEFLRQRRLLGPGVPPLVAAEMTGRTLYSDAFWLGHLLRRDWWPVGLLVALSVRRSRLARGVFAAMAWEPVRDHLIGPARLGPVESLALRVLDDASYGTGVIRNAIRKRVANVVTPRVRWPYWPRRKS